MSEAGATAPKHRYFPAVDGLRAVAVLSVLLYHLYAPALPGGFAGVDIFFVISGFVVTGSVAHLKFDRLTAFQAHFYSRRILRIAPALMVCLFVTGLAREMFVPEAWLSTLIDRTGIAALYGGSNIVLALNDDDYFSPRAAYNPFLHTWSLGIEEQFYLVFPLLMYFFHIDREGRRMSAARVVGILSLSSLAACAALSAYRWKYGFYLLPARFWELGAGVVLYLTLARWQAVVAALSARAGAVAFAASLALIGAAFARDAGDDFPFPFALLPVAGAALLIALVVARPRALAAQALSSSVPVGIGKISYSLYLWHWPVFVLFRWTVGLDGVRGVLALVLAFALAVLSYRYVETPPRAASWPRRAPAYRLLAAGLVFMVASGFTTLELLRHGHRLSLSVTHDTDDWYPDARHRLAPSPIGCTLKAEEIRDGSVRIDSWMPTGCARSGRTLHVAGDSHAEAYVPMLRQYAMDTGTQVKLYAHYGCGFLMLNKPMAKVRAECKDFAERTTALLTRAAKAGDAVFFAGLRTPRYVDQWGEPIAAERLAREIASDPARLEDARQEAAHILNTLHARGARIVFEGPTPVFKSPPFRCADWFNRGNVACARGLSNRRAALEELRAPTLAAMRSLAAEIPGVSVWDPFDVLCPGTACDAFKDGKPLFFDSDHISGYANMLLYPHFAAHLAALRLASTNTDRTGAP